MIKLSTLLKEIEKPQNLYTPGYNPEDEPEKEAHISATGEVTYYDNIRIANMLKGARKELFRYNKKHPGKIAEYKTYYESLSKMITSLSNIK